MGVAYQIFALLVSHKLVIDPHQTNVIEASTVGLAMLLGKTGDAKKN